MTIDWTEDDGYYYTRLEAGGDKKAAIQAQILKILELSEGKEDWNVVTLDKWIEGSGRLIGHIQNDQEAVGYDKGYRVALSFLDYSKALNEALDEDDYEQHSIVLYDADEELDQLVAELTKDADFKALLKAYYDTTPFSIELADRGQRIGLAFDLFA